MNMLELEKLKRTYEIATVNLVEAGKEYNFVTKTKIPKDSERYKNAHTEYEKMKTQQKTDRTNYKTALKDEKKKSEEKLKDLKNKSKNIYNNIKERDIFNLQNYLNGLNSLLRGVK